jgi:hypothetical protein
LKPWCGLEVQLPKQANKSDNGQSNTFDISPNWENNISRRLPIFNGIFIGSHQTKSKYQSWYLTPSCGLELQKPTKALKSVKGPSNTFDMSPNWERTFSSVANFSWDIYRVPLQKKNPNNKYDIWYPAVGLRCRYPLRHLGQLTARAIPLIYTPSEKELCRLLPTFHGIFIGSPTKSIYQSWYLTSCCGFELQKPNLALKSLKGPWNTFDLNPRWERTLPPVANFPWDI